MGADTFWVRSKGKTADEAFRSAVREAQYESGHGGYTGTIAEKHDFVMISVPAGTDPRDLANRLMDEDDRRIAGKRGPAGCILLKQEMDGTNTYLFFGWASS